jgi:hypothetical protein
MMKIQIPRKIQATRPNLANRWAEGLNPVGIGVADGKHWLVQSAAEFCKVMAMVISRTTTPRMPRNGWSKMMPERPMRTPRQAIANLARSAPEGSKDVENLLIEKSPKIR